MSTQLRKLRKKIRRLQKYEHKLRKQLELGEYQELIMAVKRDGIAFISMDYADDHNLEGDEAEYWIPILNGKPQRNEAFIMHDGKKYNYPQPHYLENYTDQNILAEIVGYSVEEATHVVYEDLAILPHHLLPMELYSV